MTIQIPTQYLGEPPTVEVPKGTVDYITATMLDLQGNSLTMGVEIAVTPDDPGATVTFLPAGWIGTAAAERQCKTTSVVDTGVLSPGTDGVGTRYGVRVRLDNTPAHPIVLVGWLVLV